MEQLIKGLTIYSETETIDQGYIKIKNGKIIEIGKEETLLVNNNIETFTFPDNHSLIPGMIDVHIHGANGADTMDGDYESLDKMVQALPKEGTTSFLATTITQDDEAIEKAVSNVNNYMAEKNHAGSAEILGIHLEGPFISPLKAGAQPVEHIKHPDIQQFEQWQATAGGNIKLVTLAPEEQGGLDLIRYLSASNIIASLGHSNATFKNVTEAVEAGASQVTHLFNGMSGFHHRDPGLVGGAWTHDELFTEVIADGIHSHPEAVHLTYSIKGKDRIILITDSMRAKCLKNGTYDLGGQNVNVSGGKATLEDGTLAGSILKMGHAAQNMLAFSSCSLREIVSMASENPAKQLNLFHRKGSLSTGKDADFVILDENYNVVETYCQGVRAYQKEV